jgi:DNA (cytosine-5)-methyltransferase 1
MPDATAGGLFDGCGLLAYGLHLAGWEHRWLCEVDQWRRELLGIRWPGVPIIGDVRAVGADSVPRVELIAGGFPCKGASTAGKRTGLAHPQSAAGSRFTDLRLSPSFVEWMIGAPDGWSDPDCRLSATEFKSSSDDSLANT